MRYVTWILVLMAMVLVGEARANWEKVPGKAVDIGAGKGVWIIDNKPEGGGFGIRRWSGKGWEKIPGGAARIAVSTTGVAWLVNNANEIFERKNNTWIVYNPQKASDIGAGKGVWIINNKSEGGGFGIHMWNGKSWPKIPGGASRIAVDNEGIAYLVNSVGEVFHRRNGTWQHHGGLVALDIGAGGGVWLIGKGQQPWRWTGKVWQHVKFPGQARKISVENNGTPWIVCKNGDIYRGKNFKAMASRHSSLELQKAKATIAQLQQKINTLTSRNQRLQALLPPKTTQAYLGKFTSAKIRMEIRLRGVKFVGTLHLRDKKFPFAASYLGDRLVGMFRNGDSVFTFDARLKKGELHFKTGEFEAVLVKK